MRIIIFITVLTILYLITAFLVWDINLFFYLSDSIGYRLIGLSYLCFSFIISMQGFLEHHEDYP